MRPAKILLRLKGHRPQVKAFVNVRGRSKPHPQQIHLGYLALHQELDLAKERLLHALIQKWPRTRKPTTIDWDDATKKLAKLRGVFTERARRLEPQPEHEGLLEPALISSAVSTAPVRSERPDASFDVATEPAQRGLGAPPWQAELSTLIPYLQRVAFNMTGASDEADDLVQTTLEHALRSKFDERSSLRTWLLAIMRNRHFDSLRSASRRDRALQHGVDDFEIEQAELAAAKLAAAEADDERWQGFSLYRLRELLPIAFGGWDLLELKYISGCSDQQIADIYQVQVNTISSRLFRARERLRELVTTHRDSLEAQFARDR